MYSLAFFKSPSKYTFEGILYSNLKSSKVLFLAPPIQTKATSLCSKADATFINKSKSLGGAIRAIVKTTFFSFIDIGKVSFLFIWTESIPL